MCGWTFEPFKKSALQMEMSLQRDCILPVSSQAQCSLKAGNSSAFVPAGSLTSLFTVLMGTAVSQSQDGISEMWIIPQENRLEQSAHSQLGRTQPLGACDVQPPPLIPAGTETVTYRKYNLCPITNSLRHFSPSKAQDCQCHPSQKTLSFMWLLSSWPCSSGNFHSAFWDMQTMQNFCLLLLHKAPKSFKTPVWDVAHLPQPVWPAQSVCSWSHCTGCLFPPRSEAGPSLEQQLCCQEHAV